MRPILPPSPVLVGVDGSASAEHAAKWAAVEAERRKVPLRLLFALNLAIYAQARGFGVPRDFLEVIKADGHRVLDELRDSIGGAHPALVVETELRDCDAVPALVGESATACLVVLGSRGLGGFSGILVGSTAVALAARGRCPVAVIRGGADDAGPAPAGPVVVGVDDTPTGEVALAAAFDQASSRGADLVAVRAWQVSSIAVHAHAHQYTKDWSAMEDRERESLDARVAGWSEKYPEVAVRRVVSRHRPVRGLLENSVDARLLVVGSRGHGGVAGVLLGSTSQALIYHATCPLLVVRATDPR
ncbi:universal stress protein [Actinokineospora pegani]|uniref:universal stress protein n=1 Tax=Actinokineospora pegani TaxID=2654637 RepID=UPI0012EA92A6|nr:universal stress protein [Actinokineospora pegani]